MLHRLADIDPLARTAVCSVCGPVGIRRRADNGKWRCTHVEKAYRRTACYGLRPADFEAMLAAQQGACAICNDILVVPCIDHDHRTGKIRGILCSNCNTGLGLFKDDVDILKGAIAYVGS